MKNSFLILLLTLVVTGFYGCNGTGKTASGDSIATAASTKQPIDTADARLAKDLSIFCNSQVEAAKLAETKASTQKVKNFAKQNEQLYTQLSNHLNQISESYNIKLPAEPSATAQKNLQDLKEIKSSSFDHAYLLQMLKDHNATIREYNAAKNIQCIPLKMFVGSNQAAIIKQAYAISDLKDKTP
ncbi:DUF4142 domain-containing protein [uncultured Mucilaginibacter sp.]|uniref:DUF4142 domain-containing protein n=1 Tax=uncultured Mucilaginibacter sp. TaxID=797541 RepID=UPI002638F845|nr:DUF4142 domain-containing protein [uncultured Mucilaginibacter sp.]